MPKLAEVMKAPDRVYYDKSLQCYADEYLEVAFRQIYHGETIGDEGDAIAALLDPYVEATFGEAMVPFAGCLDHIEKAAKWSMQFGELRIVPLVPEHLAQLKKFHRESDVDRELNFAAEITNDEPRNSRAYGMTLHQAILLAGVQVLRECAYKLLNHEAEITAH